MCSRCVSSSQFGGQPKHYPLPSGDVAASPAVRKSTVSWEDAPSKIVPGATMKVPKIS